MTVPDTFYSKLSEVYDAAVASGDLIYSESTAKDLTVNDISYHLAIAPSLAVKPTPANVENSKEIEPEPETFKKPFDPFDPPHPALLVLDKFNNDYAVVLNKFSVVPRHFLLVTREFVPQASPLRPEDLEASLQLIKAANKQSGKRHVGFFNSGVNSGASVTHKHIQFLTLPEGFKPFPDDIIKGKYGRDYEAGQRPLSNDTLPFAHFIVPLHDVEKGEDLGFRYSTLLSRTLTSLRLHKASPISYNFLFTEEWFLAVPRRAAESKDGISVNAVGAIGLLLAKGDEELKIIEERGPESILEEVGLPARDEEEVEYDY
jgi:ATP adenylyltransferase